MNPLTLCGLLIVFLLTLANSASQGMEPVRVTVVVVYASAEKSDTDPRLADLAREIQKREPEYTHFKLVQTLQKSIPVGGTHIYALADKQTLKVTVERARDKHDRICLSIEPPGLGGITYTCVCNKFLPVITPYLTNSGQRMILAIMAKPCTGHGP